MRRRQILLLLHDQARHMAPCIFSSSCKHLMLLVEQNVAVAAMQSVFTSSRIAYGCVLLLSQNQRRCMVLDAAPYLP